MQKSLEIAINEMSTHEDDRDVCDQQAYKLRCRVCMSIVYSMRDQNREACTTIGELKREENGVFCASEIGKFCMSIADSVQRYVYITTIPFFHLYAKKHTQCAQ